MIEQIITIILLVLSILANGTSQHVLEQHAQPEPVTDNESAETVPLNVVNPKDSMGVDSKIKPVDYVLVSCEPVKEYPSKPVEEYPTRPEPITGTTD